MKNGKASGQRKAQLPCRCCMLARKVCIDYTAKFSATIEPAGHNVGRW
jgi:hypothetical protein